MQWQEVLEKLQTGELRAAEKVDGKWQANVDVKKGILEAFKAGENISCESIGYNGFVDKHNLPVQTFSPENKVRMVPGGSSVRAGSYVASGVIIMPPAYVNIGAYIDSGTMVDSHALVGTSWQFSLMRADCSRSLCLGNGMKSAEFRNKNVRFLCLK